MVILFVQVVVDLVVVVMVVGIMFLILLYQFVVNCVFGLIFLVEIEIVIYQGGDLLFGQLVLMVKVQILLDCLGILLGVVDGWCGGMSESVIKVF